MKSIVIYHADCADGFGAAFAAWLKLGDEATYLPMHYMKTDGKTDADLLVEFVNIFNKAVNEYVGDVSVHILDFSLPRFVMDWLFGSAGRVVWLDHHKTAFEMIGATDPLTEARQSFFSDEGGHYTLLNSLKSGAYLSWEYFHPGSEVPLLIKHIDDYDRWQFKLAGTREFARAIRSYQPWSFEQWKEHFADLDPLAGINVDMLCSEGKAILRSHNQNVQAVLKQARRCRISTCSPQHGPDIADTVPASRSDGYLRRFDGLACNAPAFLASDLGHELAKQSGTFGLVWSVADDLTVRCSLRSIGDYDVSAIAKHFGGGGHRTAAGFSTNLETLTSWLS